MEYANLYIQELIKINTSVVGNGDSDLRSIPVYCKDKHDRTIRFVRPEEISANLIRLIEVFSNEYKSSNSLAELSRTFAKFYYGFIAIHPFLNGNRRTAFSFLKQRAAEKGYKVTSFNLLRKILLEGSVSEEMQKLIIVFKHVLQHDPMMKETRT